MCGLTGFVDPQSQSEEHARRRVAAMADRLVHRGPDSAGVWSEGQFAVGHRRLAIQDLSDAGKQPMLSASGRYVCALNGEIYNHLELRGQLEAVGAAPPWRGHADTETLLAAIAHWGIDEALQRCKGMFALALWDRGERCLYLARDRMGEKPLYWGWAGKALVFGSELKALACHPAFDTTPCQGSLAQYLRFSYIPAPRSIYRTVFKLEPGTILVAAGTPPSSPPEAPLRPGQHHGSISIRRYWSLDETLKAGAGNRFTDETEAVDALEEALARAVERQMISDVPLGAFLSGGIDSATIASLMQARGGRPVRTFTVGFEEAAFDEAPHAAAVARHLGTEHTEVRMSASDALAIIPDLPSIYDEPFADSSQVPTHLICRAARTQATVALSGDGADELFGGYHRYLWAPRVWQKLSWMPHAVRHAMGSGLGAMPQGFWTGMDWSSRRMGGPRLSQIGETLASCLRDVRGADDLYLSIVSQWSRPCTIILDDIGEPRSPIDDPAPDGESDACIGSIMMRQDLRGFLPDGILCKVDRAAMSVSLETRAPFLDPDVVALAARLPSSMRFRDGEGKWALRQVLERHVPRSLTDRPKAGFSIPIGEWLRGPLREWVESLLDPVALTASGLLKPAAVRLMWKAHLDRRADWSKQLWTILMLQAWHAAQSGGQSRAA